MHSRRFLDRLAIVTLCCCFVSCDVDRPQPIQPKPKQDDAKRKSESLSKAEIWNFARDFVRDRLKSPSSSSFGGIFSEYQDPSQTIIQLTEYAWGVHGWVDSDNSFGANLRTDFYLEIQLNGNTATLTYLEFEGQEPFGESIIPQLGEIISQEQKAALIKRIKESVVTRKTVGSREFFLVKTYFDQSNRESVVSQLGRDLQASSKKLKLFAWVYNQADEYQGCLVVSKKEVVFSEDSYTYPDPFRPDGYFGFREWSSPQGQFKLKAKYIGHGNGRVMITDEGDKTRDIELLKLSEADQEWVKNAPDLLPK
jgi:hypothetical protein